MVSLIPQKNGTVLLIFWALYGGVLLLGAGLSIPFSASFGYDTRVVDMPLRTLFAALLLFGFPFVILPLLIRHTLNRPLPARSQRILLFALLAVGLLARLAMAFGEPLMEDDYQRYLWDGALTANGHNPYRLSPEQIHKGEAGSRALERLAGQSGKVLERINHPSLRTIYPPVAQLGFALAYKLSPFSLTAWRLLAIGLEIISLVLLLLLLKKLDRPPLWVTLYWCNPLVIKELVNSGHMEVLLVPLLLGALLAAICRAPVFIAFLLGLAVGVKVWPGLLLPLFLRPFLATPQKLVMPLLVFATLLVLVFWPIWAAGLDRSSGFVAYAENWKTNSALLPMLEALVKGLLALFLIESDAPQRVALLARLLIAGTLALIALGAAWRRPSGDQELVRKTLFITAMMFLLSPAQLPWYATWFLPFLVFYPLYGLALLVPLLQFYYLSFYFAVLESKSLFSDTVVWIIWLPVWGVLAFEMWRTASRDDRSRRLRGNA